MTEPSPLDLCKCGHVRCEHSLGSRGCGYMHNPPVWDVKCERFELARKAS